MKSNRVLSGLAAVVLSNTALGYARHVAYADNPDRAIPAVGVSSLSAGTIHVVFPAAARHAVCRVGPGAPRRGARPVHFRSGEAGCPAGPARSTSEAANSCMEMTLS